MPRHGDSFDAAWRARTVIAPAPLSVAKPFLMRHYLRKRPGVVVLTLVVYVDGWARGMVMFSLPPTQTNVRYKCGTCWELARLYLDDDMPRNAESYVIAWAVRYIERNHPGVDCLVSYADPSRGHNGRIYRASNWLEDGRTDAGRKTARVDYQDEFGRHYSRRAHIPDGVDYFTVPRVSKFRFVYWLRRKKRREGIQPSPLQLLHITQEACSKPKSLGLPLRQSEPLAHGI
jgi:hypothetical protein